MKTLNCISSAMVAAALLSLAPQRVEAQSFEYDFDDDLGVPISVVVGYVNKVWVTETEDGTFYENFWGEPDKRLHGVQFGALYKPCLPIGAGLRTGLMLEGYSSSSEFVREMGWDEFSELSFYMPLQIAWRIPFGRNVSLTPFFGLGFNWAVYGSFQDHDWYYYDYDGDYWGPVDYQQYGNGDAPKRWNNQLEWGADLRIKAFHLGFTYSKGVRDHELYKGYSTYQDKIGINIGVDLSFF